MADFSHSLSLTVLQTQGQLNTRALDLSRRLKEEIETLKRTHVARLHKALKVVKIAIETLHENQVFYADMKEQVKQQKERDQANLQNLMDECATLKEKLHQSEDQREQL